MKTIRGEIYVCIVIFTIMRATRTETWRINIHGCSRKRDGLSVCCFIEALVPWPLHYYIIKLQIPLQWNVYSVSALPAPHIFPWPVRVSVRMRGDDYLPSAGPCMCMNIEITLEIADESLRSNLNEYLEVYIKACHMQLNVHTFGTNLQLGTTFIQSAYGL